MLLTQLEAPVVRTSIPTMLQRAKQGHYILHCSLHVSYIHSYVSIDSSPPFSHVLLRTQSYVTLTDALSNFKTPLSLIQYPQEWLDASKNHVLDTVRNFAGFSAAEKSACTRLLDQTQIHLVCFRLLWYPEESLTTPIAAFCSA